MTERNPEKLPSRETKPRERVMPPPDLGRIAIDGAQRQAREQRVERVARDAGRLATGRAARDDTPPREERGR